MGTAIDGLARALCAVRLARTPHANNAVRRAAILEQTEGIRMVTGRSWALSFLLAAAAARGAVTLPGMRAAMDAMSAANAERLAVREERELVGVKSGGVGKLIRCSPESIQRTEGELGGYMARQGCVGVSSVLSKPTAATLRQYIDAEVEAAKAAVDAGSEEFSARFGGVNCRGPGKYGNRQDLFLSASEPIVAAALGEAFTALAPLLRATVGMDGAIHEVSARPARRAPRARSPDAARAARLTQSARAIRLLVCLQVSSLVADPGAPRQCMHADTIVLPCPQYPEASMKPLLTFFVALQDVEEGMGHTVFLPRTHTPEAHKLWNVPQKQKEAMLTVHKAVESDLKAGDCAVFDSRLLHCGRANSSQKRRVLFYFTLSEQAEWPLPGGLHGSNSIRADDWRRWRVSDFV